MTWLWDIMNKPRIQITMMDEIEVAGFMIVVAVGAWLLWCVVASWFEKP